MELRIESAGLRLCVLGFSRAAVVSMFYSMGLYFVLSGFCKICFWCLAFRMLGMVLRRFS